jgi:hypothetical protein
MQNLSATAAAAFFILTCLHLGTSIWFIACI